MNRKHASRLLVAVLTLALLATMSFAQGPQAPVAQEEAGTTAPLAPAGLVASTLSYQGRLLDAGGNPVDGLRTIIFRLYLQASGGTPVWTQTHNNVWVENGFLHVPLDVDPMLFDGQELWLGIQVQGDPQEMEPRQPLLPAPYALSLRPGAVIRGTVDDLPTLTVAGERTGLHAETVSSEPNDTAVEGVNFGSGTGVAGWSPDGFGLAGFSLNAVGIYGQSENTAGFFTSTLSYGVHANTYADDPEVAAVLGQNRGLGHGVVGESTEGFGLAGFSINDVGIYGESTTNTAGFFTSTLGIGLHGNTRSEDPEHAAVLGQNSGLGPGVVGLSTEDFGLAGFSINDVGIYGESTTNTAGFFTSTLGIGVHGNTRSEDPEHAAVEGLNLGLGPGVRGTSIDGAAAIFASTNGPGIVVGAAGQEGLRIMDGVGLDYIVAGSDEDFDFKVSGIGDVFADGSYHCEQGPGSEPGVCVIQESPADFAEMLPCRAGLEPGDVLVIGSDGRLARSNQAYQPTVVGAFSTQPGYLGGGAFQGQEDYAPLAMVGIVPVKASAENGPIRPGDLLVASATPGHAMVAGPRPPLGTVIGKALEGLDAGTGTILMLAMLQ